MPDNDKSPLIIGIVGDGRKKRECILTRLENLHQGEGFSIPPKPWRPSLPTEPTKIHLSKVLSIDELMAPKIFEKVPLNLEDAIENLPVELENKQKQRSKKKYRNKK